MINLNHHKEYRAGIVRINLFPKVKDFLIENNLVNKDKEILGENWKEKILNELEDIYRHTWILTPKEERVFLWRINHSKTQILDKLFSWMKANNRVYLGTAKKFYISKIEDEFNNQDSTEVKYLDPRVEIRDLELPEEYRNWKENINNLRSLREIEAFSKKVIKKIKRLGYYKRKILRISDYCYGGSIEKNYNYSSYENEAFFCEQKI